MHRWTDLGQIPPGFGPSVVTIGNFDGVHRGHQSVLGRMVADARRVGAQSVAVTFDPHPSTLHQPGRAPELITGVSDRLELMAETGLDAVLVQNYTWEFAKQSPEEFVHRFLVDGLRAVTVVVGQDVRFGWENAGDLSTMLALGERYGFSVEVIEDLSPPGPSSERRRWSSTWIRELLAAGEVREAADILGRPHRMRGVVVRGDARGRELGFPTANLSSDSAGMVPADGVYAGWLTRVSRASTPGESAAASSGESAADEAADEAATRLPAAISIGTNPTFDGLTRRVEAYVIDRTDLDLYDDEVLLEFVERLRPTLRFDSVDELITTMNADVAAAREILSVRSP
ncbi:bifunctional riboflavin kinase/FAD synthetase [Phytoactinopolyspora halotolerans]|uniref:Riboflavin biosynthesis protein n=1 Tax=Phytoactinopolyspora halotolerans TaxID=1981512 RepID=A0A6L9S677_9ACTN|nr:bifunctional riboflavin kinase/FAD synthetase [Phytoactinopolyspora halotolerans]NEE00038.1 bifunctional riboflavin kinase/FAD synthetase [Phytoactinopolyspora halotolerans]